MTIAQDCMVLIAKKLELKEKMSPEEYYSEIMMLDRKYPGRGFREAAEEYANHIRRHEAIKPKPSPRKIDRKMEAAGDREDEIPL